MEGEVVVVAVERTFLGAGLLSLKLPHDDPRKEEAEGETEVVRLKPLTVVPPLSPSARPFRPPDCRTFKLSSQSPVLLWER